MLYLFEIWLITRQVTALRFGFLMSSPSLYVRPLTMDGFRRTESQYYQQPDRMIKASFGFLVYCDVLGIVQYIRISNRLRIKLSQSTPKIVQRHSLSGTPSKVTDGSSPTVHDHFPIYPAY